MLLNTALFHLFSCSVVSDSFVTPWAVPPRLLCPWNFPGKNTGVGCHFLLQGFFPPQGWNLSVLPGLLYCRQILYHQHNWESPDRVFKPSARHPPSSYHYCTLLCTFYSSNSERLVVPHEPFMLFSACVSLCMVIYLPGIPFTVVFTWIILLPFF